MTSQRRQMRRYRWYPGICLGPGDGYTKAQAVASVGSGWKNLVERAFDIAATSGARVSQVKEKFGGLRVYIHWDEDEAAGVEPMIRLDMGLGQSYRLGNVPSARAAVCDALIGIEEESMTVCERCGEPGEPRAGGWIKTLCESHAIAAQHEDPRTDPSVAWDPQQQSWRTSDWIEDDE